MHSAGTAMKIKAAVGTDAAKSASSNA